MLAYYRELRKYMTYKDVVQDIEITIIILMFSCSIDLFLDFY